MPDSPANQNRPPPDTRRCKKHRRRVTPCRHRGSPLQPDAFVAEV